MSGLLLSLQKTEGFLNATKAIQLLRARNAPLIITFLYQEFKQDQQINIPYQRLINRLASYLEICNYLSEDEIVPNNKMLLDYDEKAKLYLNHWIDAHYLRNIIDDVTKESYIILSKHTEKVFQVIELLQEKEFVGTESKFKDIFNKLQDLIEYANPDKERRLEELERRKEAIEAEIRRIKIDGYAPTYEDYQIKSRYEGISRLANELVGDFKEVEDNFKEITRRIYEKQQGKEMTKGKLLSEAFDALYELKKTDQGKSFYAFWQFMMDDHSQEQFQRLINEAYQILEERDIEYTNKSLQKLKTLLYWAGRKVLEKNDLLAEKLSREIVAKDQQENRQFKELAGTIKQLALQAVGSTAPRETYLTIDGNLNLFLPLERKLGEKPSDNYYISRPAEATLDLVDLDELAKIYNADMIDKKQLLANIEALLQKKSQITLKEVTDQIGINKGLAEVLAYITLLNHSDKFFVNTNYKESILFDSMAQKYLEVPQIIFSR